jgi:hypothetical protein
MLEHRNTFSHFCRQIPERFDWGGGYVLELGLTVKVGVAYIVTELSKSTGNTLLRLPTTAGTLRLGGRLRPRARSYCEGRRYVIRKQQITVLVFSVCACLLEDETPDPPIP